MFNKYQLLKVLLASAAALAAPSGFADDKLVDSVSLEAGSGSKIKMLRVGLQSDWDKRWFQSNGNHVGGYWEANLAYWRGDAYRNVTGARQRLADIGFAPVIRFQSDSKKGWYAEGGIGVHLLSKLYDNGSNQLSTHFQFGDHFGLGYVFDNRWDLALRAQHFSNGGYKKPNSGVNFLQLKASYRY